MNSIQNILNAILEGTSLVVYKKRTYSLTKTTFNNGDSIKIFAEELGGTNLISANFYKTTKAFIIKPCEMSEDKVVSFLTEMIMK